MRVFNAKYFNDQIQKYCLQIHARRFDKGFKKNRRQFQNISTIPGYNWLRLDAWWHYVSTFELSQTILVFAANHRIQPSTGTTPPYSRSSLYPKPMKRLLYPSSSRPPTFPKAGHIGATIVIPILINPQLPRPFPRQKSGPKRNSDIAQDPTRTTN